MHAEKKHKCDKCNSCLQHGVGPEEARRGLWEDLPLHMWLPLRQQSRPALSHLQDGPRGSLRAQVLAARCPAVQVTSVVTSSGIVDGEDTVVPAELLVVVWPHRTKIVRMYSNLNPAVVLFSMGNWCLVNTQTVFTHNSQVNSERKTRIGNPKRCDVASDK